MRDREKRQEAIAKGGIVANLDRSMSETWTSGVRNELTRIEAMGTFRLDVAQNILVE